MPKTTKKAEIKATIDIQPRPTSPAQKMAWRKLWQKLIAEVKSQ